MWYFFYKPYYCPFSWTFIVWLFMLQNHTVSPVVWMTSNNCHAKVKRSNEGYPTGFLYERGQSEVSSDLAPVGEENLFIPQVAIQIVKLNLKQKKLLYDISPSCECLQSLPCRGKKEHWRIPNKLPVWTRSKRAVSSEAIPNVAIQFVVCS